MSYGRRCCIAEGGGSEIEQGGWTVGVGESGESDRALSGRTWISRRVGCSGWLRVRFRCCRGGRFGGWAAAGDESSYDAGAGVYDHAAEEGEGDSADSGGLVPGDKIITQFHKGEIESKVTDSRQKELFD